MCTRHHNSLNAMAIAYCLFLSRLRIVAGHAGRPLPSALDASAKQGCPLPRNLGQTAIQKTPLAKTNITIQSPAHLPHTGLNGLARAVAKTLTQRSLLGVSLAKQTPTRANSFRVSRLFLHFAWLLGISRSIGRKSSRPWPGCVVHCITCRKRRDGFRLAAVTRCCQYQVHGPEPLQLS